MLTYNTENQTYSKLIHISQFQEIQKKMEQISERLKTAPSFPPNHFESISEICLDNIDELKKLLKRNITVHTSLNHHLSSLFLLACYFCSEKAPLEFLLEQGSEINRVNRFGYNAIMSVIFNESMPDETKLDVIKMLIDKGCDVNWINFNQETPLSIALNQVELDIANLLLDNGAIVFTPPTPQQ